MHKAELLMHRALDRIEHTLRTSETLLDPEKNKLLNIKCVQSFSGTEDINFFLQEGWVLIAVAPMPSDGDEEEPPFDCLLGLPADKFEAFKNKATPA